MNGNFNYIVYNICLFFLYMQDRRMCMETDGNYLLFSG